MEKPDIRKVQELALEELEVQHTELLPDRIEMRHLSRRRDLSRRDRRFALWIISWALR